MITTRPTGSRAAWGSAGLAGALLLLLSACGEPTEEPKQGSIAPPSPPVASLTVTRPEG